MATRCVRFVPPPRVTPCSRKPPICSYTSWATLGASPIDSSSSSGRGRAVRPWPTPSMACCPPKADCRAPRETARASRKTFGGVYPLPLLGLGRQQIRIRLQVFPYRHLRKDRPVPGDKANARPRQDKRRNPWDRCAPSTSAVPDRGLNSLATVLASVDLPSRWGRKWH